MFLGSCEEWKETWLLQTQVWQNFQWFQLTVQIRAWGNMHGKEKDVLRQIKNFSDSESLLWSLILDLLQCCTDSQKAIFLEEWLFSLHRDSQLDTDLILVETSWHWNETEQLCAGEQQMVGGDMGAETLCLIIVIVRGNLTSFLQKMQLQAPSGPSSRL